MMPYLGLIDDHVTGYSQSMTLHRWSASALEGLYASLGVQEVPSGQYDGQAWLTGAPWVRWLIRWVWYGKVFTAGAVTNRILGRELFRGAVYARDRDIVIEYPKLGLTDTLRQLQPGLYLGRMQHRRLVLWFTLRQGGS